MEIVKAVIIIIRNNKGQYFVHRRNKNKKTSPNLFGLGAGGHIENGETKEKAAERELFEETGLKNNLRYLFFLKYRDNNFANDIEVFETETNLEELQTDNGEWQWSGWVNQEKVNNLLEKKKLCPDTAEVYKKYLEIKRF